MAIGHSAATLAQVSEAADAGATLSTHLGNGVAHQQHKFDNPIVAQLAEDRLWADFIADGIHLSPAALKVMLRAKGVDRSILVTDAVSAAACPPGLYPFAGMTVEKAADGSVRQPNSPYLAGSALRLDEAVRNVVAGASLRPRRPSRWPPPTPGRSWRPRWRGAAFRCRRARSSGPTTSTSRASAWTRALLSEDRFPKLRKTA